MAVQIELKRTEQIKTLVIDPQETSCFIVSILPTNDETVPIYYTLMNL